MVTAGRNLLDVRNRAFRKRTQPPDLGGFSVSSLVFALLVHTSEKEYASMAVLPGLPSLPDPESLKPDIRVENHLSLFLVWRLSKYTEPTDSIDPDEWRASRELRKCKGILERKLQ